MNLLLPAYALWSREVLRFLRQRSRVFSAMVQPIIFWVLFGSLFSSKAFDSPGNLEHGYLQYFFPGTLVLIVLFTAIFSMFSTIEDRREGFLQGVLVSPASRLSIVMGKIGGGATLAFGQAAVFLLFAPLVGIEGGVLQLAAAAGVLFLVALELTALGLIFAWRMGSTSGFHAVMMLVMIPLWLLSGAFFPVEGYGRWMRWIVRANPVSYGVTALRGALGEAGPEPLVDTWAAVGVTALCAAGLCIVAAVVAGKDKGRNLG